MTLSPTQHLIPIICVEVKFIGAKKTKILIRAIKKDFLTEKSEFFLRHASARKRNDCCQENVNFRVRFSDCQS